MSRSNPARHSFPTRRSSDLALAHAIAAHFAARRDDPTHELVADHEAGLDHALRPLVPVVDVQVSAADRGLLRSEEHTSELQSPVHLVCRLLLEKKYSTSLPE